MSTISTKNEILQTDRLRLELKDKLNKLDTIKKNRIHETIRDFRLKVEKEVGDELDPEIDLIREDIDCVKKNLNNLRAEYSLSETFLPVGSIVKEWDFYSYYRDSQWWQSTGRKGIVEIATSEFPFINDDYDYSSLKSGHKFVRILKSNGKVTPKGYSVNLNSWFPEELDPNTDPRFSEITDLAQHPLTNFNDVRYNG